MPLPAALLERLKKRGIVTRDPEEEKPKQRRMSDDSDGSEDEDDSQHEEEEEVIAEDYDEDAIVDPDKYEYKSRPRENLWKMRLKSRIAVENDYLGHKGCPNKFNVYHRCTLFCVEHWKDGESDPSDEYMIRYKRLIDRYPLPKGWVPMWDPGLQAFYFWDEEEHMVSWLPPSHPKAQISKTAAMLRREMELDPSFAPNDEPGAPRVYITKPRPLNEFDEKLKPPVVLPPKPKPQKKPTQWNRKSRADLGPDDPMDPSSYSDIPRGTWSSGLEESSGGGGRNKGNSDSRRRSRSRSPRSRSRSRSPDDRRNRRRR